MDAILNCRMEDVEDYYELLGCDELSTVDQILAEFKVRALECHPDKNPEDPQAVENFQRLQKAKDILTNEESRDRYDYWRRSRVPIPFHQWEALSNSVKMAFQMGTAGTCVFAGQETPLQSCCGNSETMKYKSQLPWREKQKDVRRLPSPGLASFASLVRVLKNKSLFFVRV
ncbi:dnaJ homolog subfamily C member 12 isoform X3 [Phascolarctos cinereus]